MSPRALLGVLVILGLSTPGCSTGKVVTKPTDITLEAAMESVGAGLKRMRDAEGDTKTGLLPSDVTVSFNVTVSASDSKKLAVSANTVAAAALPASAGLTGEMGTTMSAARGNVITIRFTNLLFADEKQLIAKKSAQEVKDILKALKDAGITIMLRN